MFIFNFLILKHTLYNYYEFIIIKSLKYLSIQIGKDYLSSTTLHVFFILNLHFNIWCERHFFGNNESNNGQITQI